MSRNVKYIVLHCTDTSPLASVEAIKRYWKEHNKWERPGYHYIIKSNGEVVKLLNENLVSNGVLGFNQQCINIAYIGGKNKEGKHADTRTPQQEDAMYELIMWIKERHPNAELKGHCEFPNQGGCTCPNFDVKEWQKNYIPSVVRENPDQEEDED